MNPYSRKMTKKLFPNSRNQFRIKQNWGMSFDWRDKIGADAIGQTYRPVFLRFDEPKLVSILLDFKALWQYCNDTGEHANEHIETKVTFGIGTGKRTIFLDVDQPVHVIGGDNIQVDVTWIKALAPGLPPYNYGNVVSTLTFGNPSWVERL